MSASTIPSSPEPELLDAYRVMHKELDANPQKPDESEQLYYAGYHLQESDRFLEAHMASVLANVNGSNAEVIRKFESAERFAILMLRGSGDMLRESLKKLGTK